MSIKNNVKMIGVSLKQAGERLEKLNKVIEKLNMAVGAEVGYHLNVFVRNEDKEQIVGSATIDVYFFDDTKG
jgi:hypothetical protein